MVTDFFLCKHLTRGFHNHEKAALFCISEIVSCYTHKQSGICHSVWSGADTRNSFGWIYYVNAHLSYYLHSIRQKLLDVNMKGVCVILPSRWHVRVRVRRLKLTLPAGVSLQLSASCRQSFTPHSHVWRCRYQTIRPSRGLPLGLRKWAEKGTGSRVLPLISALISAVRGSESTDFCVWVRKRERRISSELKRSLA